jgi:hypothetical protein
MRAPDLAHWITNERNERILVVPALDADKRLLENPREDSTILFRVIEIDKSREET